MKTLRDDEPPPEALRLLDDQEGPAWVFDFVNQRMLWANPAGLEFWKATSLIELRERDFTTDSRSVQERLRQIVHPLKPGEWSCDSWTLFPQDAPRTVLLNTRVIEWKTTERAILFRIDRDLDAAAQSDPKGLRMMVAARVTSTVVVMFDQNGDLISENPAAVSMRQKHPEWTRDAMRLKTRYGDEDRARQVLLALEEDTRLCFEYRVRSSTSDQVLSATVRRILDPVTGKIVALITEEDITKQAHLAASLQTLNTELEARVEKRSQELRLLNRRLQGEIAQRTQAQRDAERERDFLSSLLEAIPVPVFYTDARGAYLGCNELWCQHVGLSKKQLLGKTPIELDYFSIGTQEHEKNRSVIGSGTSTRQANRLHRSDGTTVEVEVFKAAYQDLDHVRGLIGTVIDVSEQKQSELELVDREMMLSDATSATGTGFVIYDNATHKAQYCTDTIQDLLGLSDQAFGKLVSSPDSRFDVARLNQSEDIRIAVETAEFTAAPFDVSFELKEGARCGRVIRVRGYPLPSAEGKDLRRVAFLQDTTLEESLRRSQKLEALGHLTGGIAHDFNNLLGVVGGNAELLQQFQSYDAELVQEIQSACRRGAELTHNLLAYAHKQRLNAKPVDLDKHCRAIESILKRTLGADISLHLLVAPDVWTAVADAGQFEDAMLNLAINARDAMPDGGNLTIEIRNATPACGEKYAAADHIARGDFVLVTVTDDGSGMDSDVLSKATDPFFSTKQAASGSGLGLSRVFGYAGQSGGDLRIISSPGDGTTVALFLPRDGSGRTTERKRTEDAEIPRGARETVVLVEDDRHFRALTRRLLETLNYQVSSFESAYAALAHLRSGASVDVLLSDVMLPGGMKGPTLVKIAGAEFPSLRVLLISGYLELNETSAVALDQDIVLLDKPISLGDLARAMRDVLRG